MIIIEHNLIPNHYLQCVPKILEKEPKTIEFVDWNVNVTYLVCITYCCFDRLALDQEVV